MRSNKSLETLEITSAVKKSLDTCKTSQENTESSDTLEISKDTSESSKDSISKNLDTLETQDTCKHSKINHFKVTCICKNNLYIKPCKKQVSKITLYSQEFVKNPFITCNKCFYNHDLDKFFVNFHYKATKYNSKALRVLYNDIQEHLIRDSKEIAIKLKENLDFIHNQTQHINA